MSDKTYEGSELDVSTQWVQERPVKESDGGQTVAGTTDDDKGDVRTESWPAEAPDPDELSEDEVAVIKAAADPSREFSSLRELGREVVPHRDEKYAHTKLKSLYPSGHSRVKGIGGGGNKAVSIEEVQEIRQRLLDGESRSDLAEEFGAAKSTVSAYARGRQDFIDEDAIELPPIGYDATAGCYQPLTEPAGSDGDEAERAGETEQDTDASASDQNALAKSGTPQSEDSIDERGEHLRAATSKGAAVDGRWVALVTGIVAFVLGWWVGR